VARRTDDDSNFGDDSMRTLIGGLVAAVTAAAFLMLSGTAAADRYVERANRLVELVPGNSSSDDVLFPALAAMQAPPGSIPDRIGMLRLIALITTDDPRWPAVERWISADAQQEVLAKLDEVTDEDARMMLTLEYGRDAVDPSWAGAGLYVELGPENLLAPLEPRYLDRVRAMHALVVWEAFRRAEAGDADESLGLYRDLIWFYRQVMQRPSRAEQLAAYELMTVALEHVRDFVYRYRDTDNAPTSEALTDFSLAIGEREIRILRTRMPGIPAILADQLLERVYERQGSVKQGEFAVTLARIKAADDPLELFNEAATYRDLATVQGDWFDLRDAIDTVLGDFDARWDFDLNDQMLVTVPTDFAQTNLATRALVEVVASELNKFIPYRRALKTHLAGTRVALGASAYMLDHDGQVPLNLISLQPRYVDDLSRNLDLFGYDYDEREEEELLFFEPRRNVRSLLGEDRAGFGDLSATERRELLARDQPHPLEVFFPAQLIELPGGVPRDTVDYTELYQRVGGNVATGPTAQFNPNWNSGETGGRRAPDRSIVGQPAPPMVFYDRFARAMNTNARQGEILVVLPGTATGGEGAYSPFIPIFERIGRRFHFDGVRVIARGADYAEEDFSPAQLQLESARLARQLPVNVQWFDDEDGPELAEGWDIGLDDDDQDAFIVDRNGIVRAAGIEFRFISDALLELLREQPVEALLYSGQEASIAQRGVQMSPFKAPGLFETNVNQDEFVLYSRGINRRDDNPPGVTRAHPIDFAGRELLFWPPVLSLQREAAEN
jgi:hypothetical protein